MGISKNFVAACSQRRADRALKSNFGYAGATIHKSEQPCTSAGTRALVRSSLYRDQAPPSDRFQGTRNMSITSLASIDLHRSAQERSPLFAVSGVRLLWFMWKQASTQPSLNSNTTPYPPFDRSGSTFALTIL
jgi:hypothetical protein